MNYEACDGARLISLLNIWGICEIRVRFLSPRKRTIDSWCLVSNTDCTDLTNYSYKRRGCWKPPHENKHYSSCLVTSEEVTRNHLLL